MAEPTQHPGQPAGGSESAAPAAGEGTFKALAPPPPDPEQQAGDAAGYKPLSVLALLGFGLAALYAVFLVLCLAVALLYGTSLLMGSPAPLLVPLFTLAVSAAGWVQVQRSEGTRAGGRLASWGMLLSVLFGLVYGAYYFASSLAIRQQAEPFILRWFDKIKKGQLDEAFVDTLPPEQRPRADANLHSTLRVRFNMTPDPMGRGPYTQFTEGEMVRMLVQAGADAEVKPLAVNECQFREGGFAYVETFQVKLPEGTFEVMAAAKGTEGRRSEGRQWTLLFGQSHPVKPPEPTPLGTRMIALRRGAAAFGDRWLAKLNAGRPDEAYLDTLPPARRKPVRDAYRGQLALARLAASTAPGGLGPDADPEAARRLYLPGYNDFRAGSLVRVDPARFSAPTEAAKAEALAELPKVFQKPGERIRRLPVQVSFWSREGNRVRVRLDCDVLLPPRHVAEGFLVAEAEVPEEAAGEDSPEWWLGALDVPACRALGASSSGAAGLPAEMMPGGIPRGP
jgi:hypothetical protein